MQTIDAAIKPGVTVKKGQRIGLLGKEGGSGGWSHQHFEIKSLQPSGKWGTQDAYAFLWQTAVREFSPDVIAVARPHNFARVGDRVVLDAGKSWCRDGRPARFRWTFTDGSTSTEPRVERSFGLPGTYSEILEVTDSRGRTAYDFAWVQVVDPGEAAGLPPSIHAAFAPTGDVHPGDPVTFKVRTFGTTGRLRDVGLRRRQPGGHGSLRRERRRACARWLRGDLHSFARAGDYLVASNVRIAGAGRRRPGSTCASSKGWFCIGSHVE